MFCANVRFHCLFLVWEVTTMPFATNNGVRIHYDVEGQGPPLVMVHGFSATIEMWREMGYPQRLAGSHRVILVDPRGHGQSDKPHDPAEYRPEAMVGDVVAVLDQLGLQKASYVGASMGAAIGYQITRLDQDRVSSLTLMAYGKYGPPTQLEQQFNGMGRRIQEIAASMEPEAAMAAIAQMIGPRSPEDRARFLANDQKALLAFMKGFDEWPGVEDALPGVRVPALVMAAEGDPFYSSARKCAEVMPHASFVALPGGKHGLDSYGGETVVPHIEQFLARLDA